MPTSNHPGPSDQQSQPDGVPATDATRGGPAPATGPDAKLFELYNRLSELISDASKRAALLGVPEAVDAAWAEGRMLPVLRAKQRVLQSAVLTAERAQQ